MATAEQETRQTAPYVPFTTFKNFISGLKGVIPGRIDKSVMAGFSGGTQSHLLIALRFFGLIGPKGEPTAELKELVGASGTESWPDVLGAHVKTCYSDIIGEIDLTTATPHQIDELFRSEAAGGLIGSTADKASRFFLAAIKEAEIGHAQRLMQRKPRTAGKKRVAKAATSETPATPQTTTSANTDQKMIDFPIHFRGKIAGKITVPSNITTEDCKMVKIIVQAVESYAAAQPTAEDFSDV